MHTNGHMHQKHLTPASKKQNQTTDTCTYGMKKNTKCAQKRVCARRRKVPLPPACEPPRARFSEAEPAEAFRCCDVVFAAADGAMLVWLKSIDWFACSCVGCVWCAWEWAKTWEGSGPHDIMQVSVEACVQKNNHNISFRVSSHKDTCVRSLFLIRWMLRGVCLRRVRVIAGAGTSKLNNWKRRQGEYLTSVAVCVRAAASKQRGRHCARLSIVTWKYAHIPPLL